MSQYNRTNNFNLTLESSGDLSYFTSKSLLRDLGILVAFTARRGGVSRPPYSSLNLAFHVGDEKERVVNNREKLLKHFGLDPKQVICAEQVHGNKVSVVDERDTGKGAFSLEDSIQGADALLTVSSQVPLVLFFADCVPIILVDIEKRAVGVIHAGWRGVYENIAGKAVTSMASTWQANTLNMFAFIGPSIGGCCYQVGADLKDRFEERFKKVPGWLNNDHIDLRELVKAELAGSGLMSDHIYMCGNCCTSCRHDLFFSYRADGQITGRQSALAAILTG